MVNRSHRLPRLRLVVVLTYSILFYSYWRWPERSIDVTSTLYTHRIAAIIHASEENWFWRSFAQSRNNYAWSVFVQVVESMHGRAWEKKKIRVRNPCAAHGNEENAKRSTIAKEKRDNRWTNRSSSNHQFCISKCFKFASLSQPKLSLISKKKDFTLF